MSQKKVDWAIYDIDIFNLLKIYPNVTFFTKTFKFINMFPNIKNKKIMNHMKYIYIRKSHEYFTNDKVQSSYIKCIFYKTQATNSCETSC
jgi:hypothetical protein